MGMVTAYLFQYILKAPNWMAAVFIGAFIVPMAISIPFWVRLSRRFGKARSFTATLWALGVLYCLIYFGLGDWGFEGNPLLVALSCLFAGVLGVVSACGFVVAPSIKADIIDFDEYRTDQRKEGAYLAAWSFVEKSAAALAAVLLGAVLQLVDYSPNQEQTGSVKLALRSLYGLFPFVCYMAGALLFSRFRLDEAEHTRIRNILIERR